MYAKFQSSFAELPFQAESDNFGMRAILYFLWISRSWHLAVQVMEPKAWLQVSFGNCGHENAIQHLFREVWWSFMWHLTTCEGPRSFSSIFLHWANGTTVWNLQRLWVNFQAFLGNWLTNLIKPITCGHQSEPTAKRMPADHGPWFPSSLPASQCCQHVWVLAGKGEGWRWTWFHVDPFNLF